MHTLRQIETVKPVEFKEEFVKRYTSILGDKYDSFIEYSLSFLRKGIRVNTLKITVDEIKKRLSDEWILTPVPWCKEGFWIEHKGDETGHKRRDVGNLLEHALGYIYIQEPASMIPPIVLDVQPNMRVLDMCASPGSKSTQLAMAMQNTGILVANEMTYSRIAPLSVNLQRCGISNAIVTRMDGRQITGEYDAILVDAPCSGVGTIRKSLKTVVMWNPKMITRLSRIQLTLLNKAYTLLASGGSVVYSTCTTEPEENEGVVSEFLKQHPDMVLEDISLAINRSPAILSFGGKQFDPSVKKCLRIWPMDNDTEGFFVAKFYKK